MKTNSLKNVTFITSGNKNECFIRLELIRETAGLIRACGAEELMAVHSGITQESILKKLMGDRRQEHQPAAPVVTDLTFVAPATDKERIA